MVDEVEVEAVVAAWAEAFFGDFDFIGAGRDDYSKY